MTHLAELDGKIFREPCITIATRLFQAVIEEKRVCKTVLQKNFSVALMRNTLYYTDPVCLCAAARRQPVTVHRRREKRLLPPAPLPDEEARLDAGGIEMILNEFDTNKLAVINPSDIRSPIDGFPETLISVFSHILFDQLVSILDGIKIAQYEDVDGVWPVYQAQYKGRSFALAKARLGAAACVGSFEDLIAFGVKRIILLGNCGVLDRKIEDCGIIIPTKAIRDEGTSYHYAPASDWIEVNHNHRTLFKAMLTELGYSYAEGTTWTTDAFYRETPEKVRKRKEMGALCVEMECSAVQALCDFRGIDFFQFLYAGDNLDHPQWDPRSLRGHSRLGEKEKIAMLAVEFAYRIETEAADKSHGLM